jgi:hypothetical protein
MVPIKNGKNAINYSTGRRLSPPLLVCKEPAFLASGDSIEPLGQVTAVAAERLAGEYPNPGKRRSRTLTSRFARGFQDRRFQPLTRSSVFNFNVFYGLEVCS